MEIIAGSESAGVNPDLLEPPPIEQFASVAPPAPLRNPVTIGDRIEYLLAAYGHTNQWLVSRIQDVFDEDNIDVGSKFAASTVYNIYRTESSDFRTVIALLRVFKTVDARWLLLGEAQKHNHNGYRGMLGVMVSPDFSTFGRRLAFALRVNGFSGSNVSGVSPSCISSYVTDSSTPRLNTLRKVLENLPYVSARWLILGDSKKDQNEAQQA